MPKLRFLTIILTACLLLFGAAAACTAETIAITDTAGRKVELPDQVNRIVCLGPGALRLITYLQALDKVVGVEAMERRMGGRPYYLAHKKTIDSLPAVSPGGPSAINKKPDMEAILKVKPQVLFVTYMEASLADEVQASLGIPVVVMSYGRFAAFDQLIYDSLRIAGKVLGKAKRCEEVINFVEAARADLLKRAAGIPEDAKPSVFVGGIGFRGSHGLESTDSQYIPFTWLKAKTVVAPGSGKGHLFLDKEKLLGLQPDYVFVDAGGLELVTADYVKKNDFYQALNAFKDKKVFVLFPFNWYTTNVGTTIADAYAIGKIIYPGQFADVDLAAQSDDIYQKLVGAPVYAAMEGLYGPLAAQPAFMK